MNARQFKLRDATKEIQQYSQEVGQPVQVWALCANNYPFSLSGRTDFKEAFDFNGLVKKFTASYSGHPYFPGRGGVSCVEMSDDCFAHQHLVGARDMIEGKRILEDIAKSAQDNGVFICAMGTGAKLSYEHQKLEGQGFFDRPPQSQDYWFNSLLGGWGLWGKRLAQVYTGKRPAVFARKESFTDRVKLRDIPDYVKTFSSAINLDGFSIGRLDPDTEISGAEALNLALVYALNKQTPEMTILSEQMQIRGMNPNTPEELRRNNEVMAANFGFFGDMLDHGHVAIRGTRTTNDPRAYDINAFVDSCQGPLVFAHHNIMYKNGKTPATRKALEIDQEAKNGKLPTTFENPQLEMPYPELINNVNDAMLRLRSNSNVHMVVLSPEPACNAKTDMTELAKDVAEASVITARKIEESGLVESEVLPMTFVNPNHLKQVDRILRSNLIS